MYMDLIKILKALKLIKKHKLKDANVVLYGSNPYHCGDNITLYLKIENGIIKDASFEGTGCNILMYATSKFIEHIKGKNVKEILELSDREFLKEIDLADISKSRLQCALLPLKTFKEKLPRI
ncbi:MAG TPA: hypothetical protein EYH09_01220 [Candidatus Nanopusillus sp.]|nr:hypothetical protein [Candidatus Nanopusillus sp.]HIP90302.1 hypothetical protein [Candidatus Nanopusillus sp.]